MNNLFKQLVGVYKVLAMALLPFIIAGLPLIPALISDKPIILILFFISIPLGAAVGTILIDKSIK